ncbi:MAG: hypothetical protein AAFP84_13225 [Actinomycetota bacterium]
MRAEIASLLVVAPAIAVWAVGAVRRPTDRHVAALAQMYQAPLDAEVAAGLRQRIARLRRARFAGGAVGVAAAFVWSATTEVGVSGGRCLFGAAIGYGIGSIVVELIDGLRGSSAASPSTSPSMPPLTSPLTSRFGSPQSSSPDSSSPESSGTSPAGSPGPRSGSMAATADSASSGYSAAVAVARRRSVSDVLSAWVVLPVGIAVVLGLGGVALAAVERERLGLGWVMIVATAVGIVAVVLVCVALARAVVTAPERAGSASGLVVVRVSRAVTLMSLFGSAWMVVSVLGAALFEPWFGVDKSSGTSWFVTLAALYLGLSTTMGFLTTVNALPRTGGRVRLPSVPERQERMAR